MDRPPTYGENSAYTATSVSHAQDSVSPFTWINAVHKYKNKITRGNEV